MKRIALTALGLCVALSGLPTGPADAQGVSPFSKRSNLRFSEKDLVLLNKTRDELLAAIQSNPARHWSNAESGNSGTTTLTQSFTKQGLPCRKLRYDLEIAGETRRFTVPYCLAKGGEWKIAF